jgi:hypothetical protein
LFSIFFLQNRYIYLTADRFLDLDDDACLDLVRGRDRTEFDRLITEINRLRVSLYHTELRRVEVAAEAAGLKAVAASLDALRYGGGGENNNYTLANPNTSGSSSSGGVSGPSRAVPLLVLEGEGGGLEELRLAVAEMAAEAASLHCRQILATDYEVKAKRSTYVLAKLDQLWYELKCDIFLILKGTVLGTR